MGDKNKVVSCVLAVLASVCFVTGVTLLTDEGSAEEHGLRKKINLND